MSSRSGAAPPRRGVGERHPEPVRVRSVRVTHLDVATGPGNMRAHRTHMQVHLVNDGPVTILLEV